MSPMNFKFLRKKSLEKKLRELILKEFTNETHHIDWTKLTGSYQCILNRGIESLPPERKQIFTLCKIEGKNYDEVSAMLQIPSSCVSNHITEANCYIYNYLLYRL